MNSLETLNSLLPYPDQSLFSCNFLKIYRLNVHHQVSREMFFFHWEMNLQKHFCLIPWSHHLQGVSTNNFSGYVIPALPWRRHLGQMQVFCRLPFIGHGVCDSLSNLCPQSMQLAICVDYLYIQQHRALTDTMVYSPDNPTILCDVFIGEQDTRLAVKGGPVLKTH